MRVKGGNGRIAILAVVLIAVGIFFLSTIERRDESTGSAKLISIQEFPDYGEMCLWEPPSAIPNPMAGLETSNLFAAFEPTTVYAAPQDSTTTELARPPLRIALDTDPGYVAVAVNTRTDEVFLLDSNTWSIRVFNRLENTAPNAARSKPKRVITGPTSGIQYNSHIYIDPKNGDVYTVENDIGDSFSVYAENADGDAKPLRSLDVGHRGYAMAVDEEKQEIYVSVQSPAKIEVYRKTASGNEKPLRVIQGESTGLSDTHGIAIDPKNKLLFAANWGNVARVSGADSANSTSGGRFESPSITVYPLDVNGDTAPLRVIRGTRTQLDWPGTMSLDPETGELYVANSVGQSVLVFRGSASGDAAPVRVLKGPKTGISYPLGVTIDPKNKELWVTNFGNSSATVYPLAASGDVAPLRTIRSAPRGKVSLKLGKLNTLAYDTKREEILVPN